MVSKARSFAAGATPAELPAQLNAAAVWLSAGAIALIAIALRLYHFDGFVTFYPDSYGQLRAAENLSSLEFPISYHYPPGIAMFLAPFFLLLPDSLLTMQIGIAAAGLALVVLAYVWCSSATEDRRAAFIYAFAVAIGATFVFHSRIALLEVINTLLIGAALWLAPGVARRGAGAGLVYGVLVFAMASARYTNVIVLPALVLAATSGMPNAPSWRSTLAVLRSPAALTTSTVVGALGALYVTTSTENITRFTNPQYGSIIDLDGYVPRLIDYAQASLTGYGSDLSFSEHVAAGVLLAFAFIGAQRMWRTNRGLALAIAYLALTWCPVHALYQVFFERYAMAVFFLLLLPASAGVSATLDGMRRLERPAQRIFATSFLAFSLTLVASGQLAQDFVLISDLYDSPAANSERSYDTIRDALRAVDGSDAVFVSGHILAVDKANQDMSAFDLTRHSARYGINDDSVERLLAFAREEIDEGHAFYYHYTPYEATGSQLHRYELGFDAYFEGLQEQFALTELARTPNGRNRLYRVEPR